jgi:hypothetical protein
MNRGDPVGCGSSGRNLSTETGANLLAADRPILVRATHSAP